MKHIIFSSFGKDSMATTILAYITKAPVDLVVYCKVMFDKETSGEVPEHEQFINEVAIPKVEKDFKFKVHTVKSEQTYIELFKTPICKGKRAGMLRGSPICQGCWVLRDLKLKPMNEFKRQFSTPYNSYIGLAKDEENRIARLAGGQISLLQQYGYAEADAYELDKQFGLLSPIYDFAPRNGCFFCPNAKQKEMRHLRDYHPDLWGQMLELERTPNAVKKNYNREMMLADIEYNFDIDDRQMCCFD